MIREVRKKEYRKMENLVLLKDTSLSQASVRVVVNLPRLEERKNVKV